LSVEEKEELGILDEACCWRIPSSGMWRRVDILLTDVSEERIAYIFRV
jgi:hypothetical protein